MKEYFIVDRIEGDIAVFEDKDLNMLQVGLAEIPFAISPGDCLYFDEIWRKDEVEAMRRQGRVKALVDDLFD